MMGAVEALATREFLLGAAAGAAVVALLVLVTWVLARRTAAPRQVPVLRPASPAPPAADAAGPPHRPIQAQASASGLGREAASPSDAVERRVLVDGLADLALRLPGGLDREAVGILARAGVQRRAADGLPFDPAWQDALGSEPATDPAMAGTVVRTLRDYFDDRGRPASRPQVVVLTSQVPGPPSAPAR